MCILHVRCWKISSCGFNPRSSPAIIVIISCYRHSLLLIISIYRTFGHPETRLISPKNYEYLITVSAYQMSTEAPGSRAAHRWRVAAHSRHREVWTSHASSSQTAAAPLCWRVAGSPWHSPDSRGNWEICPDPGLPPRTAGCICSSLDWQSLAPSSTCHNRAIVKQHQQ